MLVSSFQTAFLASLQILIMGAVGYVLAKKNILPDEGVKLINTLVVKCFLPFFIINNLTGNFDFQRYSFWWMFPLISFGITVTGFLLSRAVLFFHRSCPYKNEFTALVTFQNAGYIPLLLVTSLLSGAAQKTLYVYIFLLIIGFDLTMWSLGVWLITHKRGEIDFRHILNPPFLTTVGTLILIFFKGHTLIPSFINKPIEMLGQCTLPLAMIVVGGTLAKFNLGDVKIKSMSVLISAKLILMPILALMIVKLLSLNYLLGLFIVLETVPPSAVSLSVLGRYFDAENQFINQGIFWGYMGSIVTIPFFLMLYEAL